LLLAGPATSLQYDNGGSYDADRHDRFVPGTSPSSATPNPSFFLADHASDLVAVGWQTYAPGIKLTLISPQHFLNANHYKATGSVSFLDSSGTVRSYGVASNEQVYGDLAVGTLVAPIPPEHGVSHIPIASFERDNHFGREVYYVGNPPPQGSTGFSVGRTAIGSVSQDAVWLNTNGVDPANSVDRVFGITGDSGGPSLFDEGDALSLVGTHYSSTSDQTPGSSFARAALDDYLAGDGQLLDVYGEGRLGDPGAGDLVVTGVDADLGIHFDVVPGESEAVRIRIHDFSGSGSSVEASVTGSDFGLRVPGTTQLLQDLVIAVPADATGAELEIVYTPSGTGTNGSLSVSDAGYAYVIPLDNDAPDPGYRAASMLATPSYQSGMSGGNGIPSETRTYTLEVTNNDEGDTAAAFSFAASCPSAIKYPCSPGWSFVFDPIFTTISPGATASVDVHVTPAEGADVSIYQIAITAHDAQVPVHNTSAGTIYWVDSIASDTSPPTAPTGLWASGDERSVTITWNPSQDDTGIDRYNVTRDGVQMAVTSNTSWTDTRTKRNQTHVYVVYAVDVVGKVSDPSTWIAVENGVVVGGGDDAGGGAVCQPTRSNEKGKFCHDLIDNDCDGSIDQADPDC